MEAISSSRTCLGGRQGRQREEAGVGITVWRLRAVGERPWIAQGSALERKGKVPTPRQCENHQAEPCVCSTLPGERERWDSIKSPLWHCQFRATLDSPCACVFVKALWMGPSPRGFGAGAMWRCDVVLQRCEIPLHRTAVAL